MIEIKENRIININKTEKPHSFECGKAGQRHKIYYDKIEDLTEQLLKLIDLGLISKEEIDLKI